MIRIVRAEKSRPINRYFETNEFKCHGGSCGCKVNVVAHELLEKLTILRSLNGPLKINSGFRCHDHNADEGGKELSYHLSGQAADIALPSGIDGKATAYLMKCVKVLFNYHYIGNGFVHVDIRELS